MGDQIQLLVPESSTDAIGQAGVPGRVDNHFGQKFGSALVWAGIFSLAGYLFGKSASLFLEDVGKYEHYLLGALAGLIMTIWLFHIYHAWKAKNPARTRLARMRALRATHTEKP